MNRYDWASVVFLVVVLAIVLASPRLGG